MLISTDGVVLRSFPLEEDRILTLLTRQLGVITAYANHASRPKNALASTTELLSDSDFVLFRNKERYTVNSADSRHIPFSLRSDFERLCLASYFCELFSELAPTLEPADDYLDLLRRGLYYLEQQSRPLSQIKSVVELRLLTLAGYMPDLVACRECGCFESESMYFSWDGYLLCNECFGQRGNYGYYSLTQGVLAAMRHISYAASTKVFSFRLSPEGFSQLANIVEAYLLHHLEKTLPTLEFYRSISV